MPNPTIASNRLQTLEVRLDVATKIAFDQQAAPINHVYNLPKLLRGKILSPDIWVDISLFKNPSRRLRAQAIDIGQGSFDSLFSGNFDSK